MGSIGKSSTSAGGITVVEKVDDVNTQAQKKANDMTAAQLSKYIKSNGLQTAFNKRKNATDNWSFSNITKIQRDLVMDDLRKKALKKSK